MTDKALISDLTWRSLEMQRKAFPNMPHFIAPYDLDSLLRPTRRSDNLRIHVISLGIVAKTEKEFCEVMGRIWDRKATLIDAEDGSEWGWRTKLIGLAVKAWRSARVMGAAKIGARISADKKKAESAKGIAKIADRWPKPSKEWPTAVLLAEADLSRKTVEATLGKRPIAQYNYQAAQKRKERRNDR